jgi:hypothetical protein
MPDGSQQPTDPAAQRAEDQMRDWKEQHHEGDGGGWIGNVVNTIGDMMAAAEAGQFAVSPDTGAAIIKQLGDVQAQVSEMRVGTHDVSVNARLGGGYAEQVATFNVRVGDEGPGQLLGKFSDELEQLKNAVARSIQNYRGSDSGSEQNINAAGNGDL